LRIRLPILGFAVVLAFPAIAQDRSFCSADTLHASFGRMALAERCGDPATARSIMSDLTRCGAAGYRLDANLEEARSLVRSLSCGQVLADRLVERPAPVSLQQLISGG
jgi:hypothetical protein